MTTPHTVFQNRSWFKKSLTLIVLLLAVALAGINAGPRLVAARASVTPAIALQTTAPRMVSGTLQVINNSAGDQSDAHIDCNIVSYTDDDFQGAPRVRYFDFATNSNQLVPSDLVTSFSDVSSGRIAFTEPTPTGMQIIVFDTATQVRTPIAEGVMGHSRPAFGGDLLVFEDRTMTDPKSTSAEADLRFCDLSLEFNLPIIATVDNLFDKNPSVSADGSALVWEKCQTNTSGCDIYGLIRFNDSSLIGGRLTDAGEDRSPDTNGQIAVYTSDKSGETDIYYQPMLGGTETRIPIPGDQRDVSIRGNLIAFASQVQFGGDLQYDIFVYDLSTANLYQVTNTQTNELAPDITVCNEMVRVVYSSLAADVDLHAFTFQLPSPAENEIEDLIELVQDFNLPSGTAHSLMTKLEDALLAIENSDTAAACDSLASFIKQCRAQSGKKLPANQANQLINSANQVKTELGCQ